MRSIDGEVVSELHLEKKKRTAKLCGAKFMLHALLEEISANENKACAFTQEKTCVFRRACPVCQWLPIRGSCAADGEGYPLKMGALRAGNA